MTETVQCKICNKEMKDLTNHIVKIHKMTVVEYKNKFNVSKVCLFSLERRQKISQSLRGKKVPRERVEKMRRTQLKMRKNGTFNQHIPSKEEREKMSNLKKEFYKTEKGLIAIDKIRKSLIGKKSPLKGETKYTSEIVSKVAKSVSKTMRENPKLQFNYRLAQKRKNGKKFGGEERLDWCLKQAGYVEGVDYVYNKPVKVFDSIKRNEYRTFYPDFLLKGNNIIEVDGVCHFSEEGKRNESDNIRTNILKLNGYKMFWRIKHEELMNKENLYKVIKKLQFFRDWIQKQSFEKREITKEEISNSSLLNECFSERKIVVEKIC